MPPGMMGQDGGYSPDSGRYDDLKPKVEGSLSINPKTVPGMENYRPGDTVNLTVKVRWPQDASAGDGGGDSGAGADMGGDNSGDDGTGGDGPADDTGGMIEPEIISIEAEPMADGPRVTRMREKAGRGL